MIDESEKIKHPTNGNGVERVVKSLCYDSGDLENKEHIVGVPNVEGDFEIYIIY